MKKTFAYLMVLFLFACRHAPVREPVPDARAMPGPTQPFPAAPRAPLVDLTALAGRRICLDPGHGGPWAGAIAPANGLRESDINLRVALRVRDLLEEHRASVILTRTGDYAMQPDSMARDLTARAAMAAQHRADLFVSIHHNADIEPGSQKNDIEVYYKFQDAGPSLDLAQCLLFALARHLPREDEAVPRLLPGNYRVLRLTDMPSVLLESSYLTCDANAAYLATDDGIDTEARAIFEGLAFYAALDPPKTDSVRVEVADDGLACRVAADFSRGLPLDYTTVDVILDGKRAPGRHWPTPRGFVWMFSDPLGNGRHTARLTVRNTHGAAERLAVPIHIARPPRRISIEQRPPQVARDSGIEILFEIRVLDAIDQPVADGTEVQLVETGQTVGTVGSCARFYLAEGNTPGKLTFRAGDILGETHLTYGSVRHKTMRCRDACTGRPIGHAAATALDQTIIASPEGWFRLPEDASTVTLSAPGYASATVSVSEPHTVAALEPIAAGLFHGRRIVLDPAYGGRVAGLIGPTGTRASDVNLDVAARTARLLRDAGATVILTREEDSESSGLDRLECVEAAGPELLLIVSYGMPSAEARVLDSAGMRRDDLSRFFGYYPGSSNGMRLARALGERFEGVAAAPCVAYLVQQTSCTALLFQPACIADPDEELRYRSLAARDEDARRVYHALSRYFEESAR